MNGFERVYADWRSGAKWKPGWMVHPIRFIPEQVYGRTLYESQMGAPIIVVAGNVAAGFSVR